MTERMGAIQARSIASRIDAVLGEVTHWQAAHPQAGDLLVDSLEHALRHAWNMAHIIDASRRTPGQPSAPDQRT